MKPKEHRLTTLAQADSLLTRLARNNGCTVGAMRVLCGLADIDTVLHRMGVKQVRLLTGLEERRARQALRECVDKEWLIRKDNHSAYYTPTAGGQAVMNSARSAESKQRVDAAKLMLAGHPARRVKRKPALRK